MVDRTLYWGTLTPPEVRRASLWALGGVVIAYAVGPMVAPYWPLLSIPLIGIGSIVATWKLIWISIGAPGLRVGKPGEFDEREIAERHQSMAVSYAVVSLLVIGSLGFDSILHLFGTSLAIPRRLPAGLGTLVIFGLMALPGIVHAWRSKRIEAAVEDED